MREKKKTLERSPCATLIAQVMHFEAYVHQDYDAIPLGGTSSLPRPSKAVGDLGMLTASTLLTRT